MLRSLLQINRHQELSHIFCSSSRVVMFLQGQTAHHMQVTTYAPQVVHQVKTMQIDIVRLLLTHSSHCGLGALQVIVLLS